MSCRKVPFQFTTSDPVKRQEELHKRFGVPSEKKKMFVDFTNPAAMNGSTSQKMTSPSGSPRLQHRVPTYMENCDIPVKISVDSHINGESPKKPHVRVVPIEIEGADTATSNKRHRIHSSPIKRDNAEVKNDFSAEWASNPKQPPSQTERVCNIPIKVEPRGQNSKVKITVGPKSQPVQSSLKKNGCNVSKEEINRELPQKQVPHSEENPVDEPPKPDFEGSLKKIQSVCEKLKGYHAEVQKFVGTTKDKQYRYLDEMLTRCMLDLDDVETYGDNGIRQERKAAVRAVQISVDLLDVKVNAALVAKMSKQGVEIKDVDMECVTAEENSAKQIPSTVVITEVTDEQFVNLDEISVSPTIEEVEMEEKTTQVPFTDKTVHMTDLINEIESSSATESISPSTAITSENESSDTIGVYTMTVDEIQDQVSTVKATKESESSSVCNDIKMDMLTDLPKKTDSATEQVVITSQIESQFSSDETTMTIGAVEGQVLAYNPRVSSSKAIAEGELTS